MVKQPEKMSVSLAKVAAAIKDIGKLMEKYTLAEFMLALGASLITAKVDES
jgi:hypothetical protein